MVSEKIIYKSFRIKKTLYKQNPVENFYFHYLPKLYIDFIILAVLSFHYEFLLFKQVRQDG